MKKKLLTLLSILLLSGCSYTQGTSSTSSLNQSTSSTSSQHTSSASNSSSSVSSNSSSSINSASSNVSSNGSSSNVSGVNYKLKYSYHPTSEPDYSKQFPVLNHIGDISSVWEHYRGEGVSLAVIDSGFDINHPEFKNRDGSSRISERSVSIYTNSSGTHRNVGRNNVGITDGDSHGTMCAGLAASGLNGKGITGVAPECELILIKIDKKAQSMADAFRYCGDNNIRVVSVSLGMYPSSSGASSGDIIYEAGLNLSTYFNDSINYAYNKGTTIIAATGNSLTTTVSYPAGCPNVIGAGGTQGGSSTLIWNEGGEGSNYNGSVKYVDVFSPSSEIYAPGYNTSNSSSTYWSGGKGTSFSAPVIAGAAALYFQKYPNKTNADFELALKNTCVNISSYNNGKDMGYGRLDVGALLNISEDKVVENIVATTTKNKLATKINFTDEAGWNIRTFHVYDLTFEAGYGYYDFEKYLDYEYGRVPTSSYTLESTSKCWAYSDEGWSGDYFINSGVSSTGSNVKYQYVFPWWVKSATYQFVNNNNWLPKEGYNFGSFGGYGREVDNYFWYKGNTDTGTSYVVNSNYTHAYPAVKVYVNNSQVDTTIVYDYYENSNAYLDSSKQVKFERNKVTKDLYLFA